MLTVVDCCRRCWRALVLLLTASVTMSNLYYSLVVILRIVSFEAMVMSITLIWLLLPLPSLLLDLLSDSVGVSFVLGERC